MRTRFVCSQCSEEPISDSDLVLYRRHCPKHGEAWHRRVDLPHQRFPVLAPSLGPSDDAVIRAQESSADYFLM